MSFDHTKILISKEDVEKLYAIHKLYVAVLEVNHKEAIKTKARLHMEYTKFCHYLGDKYGFDPLKYLITTEGKLVLVTVKYIQKKPQTGELN